MALRFAGEVRVWNNEMSISDMYPHPKAAKTYALEL
jgi:hypothetical protein